MKFSTLKHPNMSSSPFCLSSFCIPVQHILVLFSPSSVSLLLFCIAHYSLTFASCWVVSFDLSSSLLVLSLTVSITLNQSIGFLIGFLCNLVKWIYAGEFTYMFTHPWEAVNTEKCLISLWSHTFCIWISIPLFTAKYLYKILLGVLVFLSVRWVK